MPVDPPSPPDRPAAGVVLGVGASRGCPPDELRALALGALAAAGLPLDAVVAVASADVKADEPAILALSAGLGVPARFLPAARLATVDVPTPSAVVAAHVGTPSVAEAAALLVADRPGRAGAARLLVPKRRSAHATCAVALVGGAPVTPAPSPAPTEVPLP